MFRICNAQYITYRCFVIVSSLRSVIEKPPIVGKELAPLSGHSLTGFRLHPGPVCTLFLFSCVRSSISVNCDVFELFHHSEIEYKVVLDFNNNLKIENQYILVTW